PEVMQIAEPESTRDDAHPIATSIASVGRVKRLRKIADQTQPELERDQPQHRRGRRAGPAQASVGPVAEGVGARLALREVRPLCYGNAVRRPAGRDLAGAEVRRECPFSRPPDHPPLKSAPAPSRGPAFTRTRQLRDRRSSAGVLDAAYPHV